MNLDPNFNNIQYNNKIIDQSNSYSTPINSLDNIIDLLNITNRNDLPNLNSTSQNVNFISNDLIKINAEKFHECFKNDEISLCFTIKKSLDGTIISSFYMSNLKPSPLTNVKINFMVQKFVSLKVLSTSGNILNPMQLKGIKKVNFSISES